MNKTLFAANIRSNLAIFFFVTGLLLIYVSTSLAFYDPKSISTLESMFNLFPKAMLDAMGFSLLGADLASYLAGYLYGFIFIVFPLIYIVVVANKLMAKHVETGSMAYLLTTPNSRIRIATTQAVFLIVSIVVILALQVAILVVMSAIFFPGSLDGAKFLRLNLVTFLTATTVGGVSFLASSIAADSKTSLAIGGGIPIIFFLVKMLSEISRDLGWLRYFSVYSCIDVTRIFDSVGYTVAVSASLAAASAALYAISIVVFHRRSLAI